MQITKWFDKYENYVNNDDYSHQTLTLPNTFGRFWSSVFGGALTTIIKTVNAKISLWRIENFRNSFVYLNCFMFLVLGVFHDCKNTAAASLGLKA